MDTAYLLTLIFVFALSLVVITRAIGRTIDADRVGTGSASNDVTSEILETTLSGWDHVERTARGTGTLHRVLAKRLHELIGDIEVQGEARAVQSIYERRKMCAQRTSASSSSSSSSSCSSSTSS